jgi:hypothetical protein
MIISTKKICIVTLLPSFFSNLLVAKQKAGKAHEANCELADTIYITIMGPVSSLLHRPIALHGSVECYGYHGHFASLLISQNLDIDAWY